MDSGRESDVDARRHIWSTGRINLYIVNLCTFVRMNRNRKLFLIWRLIFKDDKPPYSQFSSLPLYINLLTLIFVIHTHKSPQTYLLHPYSSLSFTIISVINNHLLHSHISPSCTHISLIHINFLIHNLLLIPSFTLIYFIHIHLLHQPSSPSSITIFFLFFHLYFILLKIRFFTRYFLKLLSLLSVKSTQFKLILKTIYLAPA